MYSLIQSHKNGKLIFSQNVSQFYLQIKEVQAKGNSVKRMLNKLGKGLEMYSQNFY